VKNIKTTRIIAKVEAAGGVRQADSRSSAVFFFGGGSMVAFVGRHGGLTVTTTDDDGKRSTVEGHRAHIAITIAATRPIRREDVR
jgi:hypothetical protein